ncbi:hypothetical protein [Povalibacter sp.]|uniref:hypothetical protein n=1 Tax=Povalibacter sp. TaxID=1962978 RepID=UPI002F3FD927
MRRFIRPFLIVICSLSATTALAQGEAIQGVFVSTDTSKAAIIQAIYTAIAKMNFLTRAVARSRLLATNPLYQRIEITNDGSQITVRYDKGRPVVMPADGSEVKWTRDDGEEFNVAARAQGAQLQQTFKAEDGQRLNQFSLSPDGTLTLNVTIESPRLPAPLKYSLTYRRH